MTALASGAILTVMHRMTVSFGDQEFEGLQALAQEADRSHAWVVRYAVRELLNRVRAGQLELPLLAPAGTRRIAFDPGED